MDSRGQRGHPPSSARRIPAGTGAIRETIPRRAESGEWKRARLLYGKQEQLIENAAVVKGSASPKAILMLSLC